MILTAILALFGCNQRGGKISSVAISPANQSMAPGTSQLFTATATFDNGDTFFWSDVVTWTSSNPSVTANNTLGSNGIVTANNKGTSIITATDTANNLTAVSTVTVTDPVSFKISPVNPGIAFGTGAQLSAIGVFPDGTSQNIASATSIAWSSSNTDIVNVSNKTGFISASTYTGTATISAIYTTGSGTLSDFTNVTVTQTALASIAVTPTSPTTAAGTTLQLFATGTYADATTRDMTKSVSWTSSDNTVASVDGSGLVTGISAGAVTISIRDPLTNIAGSTAVTVTAN